MGLYGQPPFRMCETIIERQCRVGCPVGSIHRGQPTELGWKICKIVRHRTRRRKDQFQFIGPRNDEGRSRFRADAYPVYGRIRQRLRAIGFHSHRPIIRLQQSQQRIVQSQERFPSGEHDERLRPTWPQARDRLRQVDCVEFTSAHEIRVAEPANSRLAVFLSSGP